ncbi:MAG: RNA polymerase sigma factor [Paenibacillus sp.]|nr:RNA polymerase sigma factor [Paenibacillus sp.]
MDRKEFESIAPELRDSIVTMVRRIVGSSDPGLPDDVAQDTLLRLWTLRDDLDSYRSVHALAMVMARNRAIDLLRSAHPDRHLPLDGYDSPDTAYDPHQSLEYSEAGHRLSGILSSLPSAQQALIKMRHIDGMEIDEIAALTGSSNGAIRTMLSRARNHIKELFLQQNMN